MVNLYELEEKGGEDLVLVRVVRNIEGEVYLPRVNREKGQIALLKEDD